MSTLYTTLRHNLIRNKFVDLIENTFRSEEVLYFACNEERAFFASKEHKNMIYGLVKKRQIHLFIFRTIFFIRFGSKLYIQNVGIPMGTNRAPLLLISFCSAMRVTS